MANNGNSRDYKILVLLCKDYWMLKPSIKIKNKHDEYIVSLIDRAMYQVNIYHYKERGHWDNYSNTLEKTICKINQYRWKHFYFNKLILNNNGLLKKLFKTKKVQNQIKHFFK